jgi:branched-subunit amino acid aminotransferase/4-amino-4-deoxychorismate lyase
VVGSRVVEQARASTQNNGISVYEKSISTEDLLNCSIAFHTNSLIGIKPIRSVNQTNFNLKHLTHIDKIRDIVNLQSGIGLH